MTTLRGRASTYGNYPGKFRDSGDNNRPALGGASNNKPGIAVYNRKTLGHYWRVTAPNGKTAVVQQTDLGPAPFTKRVLDVNSVAAKDVFGLKYGNSFPTDQGQWKLEDLGKKNPGNAGAPLTPKGTKGAQAMPNHSTAVDSSTNAAASADSTKLNVLAWYLARHKGKSGEVGKQLLGL